MFLLAQRPHARLISFPCLVRSSRPGLRSFATDASLSISEDQIANLASRKIHQLTLSDLVKYFKLSRFPGVYLLYYRHGQPPLSTASLLSSANFTSSLIPVRLANRVRALRNLPFIVVSNPNISKIYQTYIHSLKTLIPFYERKITDIEGETRFTDALADLVQSHANTIPILARGFLECRKYIAPDTVTHFLEEHLRARIGTRLIAEQHIALHLSSKPHASTSTSKLPTPPSSYIGVIDTALRPASVLSHCETFVSELCEYKYGVRPSLTINGAPETRFAHIPTHLEYVLTELLKNAFRATVESGREREPIEITIAMSAGDEEMSERDLATMSLGAAEDARKERIGGGACGPGDETLTIRIRDRGGGISPQHLPHIWGYSFTTFSEDDPTQSSNTGSYSQVDALNTIAASGSEASTIAGLGYGLPLSRAYAEYFGGGIHLQSLWGWGTDVYLRLKGLKGF
ncbi:MAG: hypothetical protein MMC23_004583 [Stictis urceolatum]|nr:hypothetical protein [Stictis urceolata]